MANNTQEIESKIELLREEINKYDYAYYTEATSLISDYDYDMLLLELSNLEKQFPQFITSDSPTQRVAGQPATAFTTVLHKIPMLSLANSYNQQDIIDFNSRVEKELESESYSYFTELKYDGVSMSIHYENGVLTQAVTRGNGIQGDDVTANIKTVRSIPLKAATVSIDGVLLTDFEVRGEVYINDADFLKINERQAEQGLKQFANARNLTAGTIKLLNSNEVAKRPLKIVCYYLYSQQVKLKSQSENIEVLKQLGFPTSEMSEKCDNINAVWHYINKWQTRRHSIGNQTDGIVIKVDSLRQQDFLGAVGRSPKWAIAYKYEPEQAETILNDITLQVGRTGAITPVAELEPVLLAGSTISRATLHNADFIAELDIRIGDSVIIEKGGDVIPKISKVVTDKRQANLQPFIFPTHCICEHKTPIERPEGEANYYCTNPQCPWQLRKRIEHFASRNAMDINGLGEKVINRLCDLGYIKDIADIYDLHKHKDELINLEGMGNTSITNMLTAIEGSKEKPFHSVLYAIGIRFVGEKTAKILAKHFVNIQALSEASIDAVAGIYEIGYVIANSVVNALHNDKIISIVERLKAAGLSMENKDAGTFSNKFNGMTFVFTGELQSMTRSEATNIVEELGGKDTKSVTKKTSYVVVGAAPGSKYQKALSLSIPILNEEDFMALVADDNRNSLP